MSLYKIYIYIQCDMSHVTRNTCASSARSTNHMMVALDKKPVRIYRTSEALSYSVNDRVVRTYIQQDALGSNLHVYIFLQLFKL